MAGIQRIVLATDLSERSTTLFSCTLSLALRADAVLYLVHIADSDAPEGGWERLPTVGALLERWGRTDAATRVHLLEFAPSDGDVQSALTRRAAELQPDLFVVGTQSRQGLDRLLTPSVSAPVVRELRRMALFVPAQARGFVDGDTGEVRIRTVMVPVTDAVPQQPMLDALARALDAFGVGECRFVLVHVGELGALPALPLRPDWSWKTDRRTGAVVEQLLEAEVEHAPDLIVMATEGPRGIFDALVGSTTERVIRRAQTPVLAVPV